MKMIYALFLILLTVSCNSGQKSSAKLTQTPESSTKSDSNSEIEIEKREEINEQNQEEPIETTIKGKISGLKRERDKIRLAYYFLDKTYIRDSTITAVDGSFTFKGEYPDGLYLITFDNNQNSFQIILNNEEKVEFEAFHQGGETDIVINKSEENRVFWDWINYLKRKRYSIKDLDESLKDTSGSKKETIEDEKKIIESNIEEYRNSILKRHNELFVSKLLKSSSFVKIPPCENLSDEECKLFRYRYSKAHYFDNIDLTDTRMLRTPKWHSTISTYLENMVSQQPDSLIKEIDKLAGFMKSNTEAYKNFIIMQVNKYAESKYVGFDAIYVHIVKKYYESGEAPWVAEETLNKMIDTANKLEPILIGKEMRNFKFKTLMGTAGSLFSLKGEIILLHLPVSDSLENFDVLDMHHLGEIQDSYEDRGVQIVTLYPQLPDGSPRNVVERYGRKIKIPEFIVFLKKDEYYSMRNFLRNKKNFILDKEKKIVAKDIRLKQCYSILDNLLN